MPPGAAAPPPRQGDAAIIRFTLVVATALALTAPAPVARADDAILFGPCAGLSVAGLRCGYLPVPENPAEPEGRRIRLHVAVAPARGPKSLADPMYFVYGGPGVGASDEAARSIRLWMRARARRDLVFIDQRGTGRSAPLRCEYGGDPADPNTYAVDLFDTEFLAACLARHRAGRDLTRYGTAQAVRDIEAVRRALGHERMNLIGESYGTRVVQEYIRRHPHRVRSALLLGAVPPSASITEGMARLLDATLEQLFASCETDRDCAAAYPRLRADTFALLERARTRGITATVSLAGGLAREATISRAQAIAWIRSRLYSVQEAARLPGILTRAARGDARALVRGALVWRRAVSRSIAEGMYGSVACAEDMPFVDVRAETDAVAGTLMGDHRVASQQAACALWPRVAVAADIKQPVTAAVPLLVINGDRDPATSLDWARRVVSHAPDSRLVVARNRAHAMSYEFESCLGRIAMQFIDAADVDSIDVDCVGALRLPPFVIDTSPP